ncbi:hypothetical protein MYRA21_2528 [Myroides sp. A21]|uniref:hypothetical protein n=1 Tax=Myroides sp. A21 TaxID=1583100 RepID=UPI00057CAD5E|nr:hypothetical protein [Myroides sp. A21]AJA69640.1 hypothetical protein MYRA21_2528 [Myroides sp. A21]
MEIWNKINYIKDVKFLKDIITENNILGDFTGLNTLIESIENTPTDLVDYKLSNFSIYLKGAIAGAKPNEMHFCKIDLENRLALKDNFNEKTDPLFKYTLDLKISLFKSEQNQTKEHCCTWHLDKEDKELDFSYVHPYYHIQFGGRKHEYLYADMAILSSPRIPHPPMDIILAFHFVLNNFIDRKKHNYVDKILMDIRYLRILQNSKKRLWESYFNGFTSDYDHDDYKLNRLFPLYT